MNVSPNVTRAEIDWAIHRVSTALTNAGRTDGGAFDPERHPNLTQPPCDYPALWWTTFWLHAKHFTDTSSRIHT